MRVLDRDEAHIGRVRFLGVTLWTDFLLDGEGEGRAARAPVPYLQWSEVL